MIVNINQCASTYDETLYVAKFSAIASQVSRTHEDHGTLRHILLLWEWAPFHHNAGGMLVSLPCAFPGDYYLYSHLQVLLN